MSFKEKIAKEMFHVKNAFLFALKGLCAAWKSEIAFRQEVLVSIVIIPLALYFGKNGLTHAILIISWLIVPIVEIINTALEAVVDRISTELHPLSQKIKDLGSAAVLLSIVQAVLVWLIVLL